MHKGQIGTDKAEDLLLKIISPEIVAHFGPVPEDDDAAGGEAKKVLDIVLALYKCLIWVPTWTVSSRFEHI